jgi:hypothetical protein
MEKNNEIKRGQWRTGYFIRSVKNAHWPQHQVDLINKDENRIVFENFTEEDKGISRKRICICENKEDASLICEAVNNYDKLKEDNASLLDALKGLYESNLGKPDYLDTLLNNAESAIKKAESK